MNLVQVFNSDVADPIDINRLSSFPETYLETLLKTITDGQLNVLFGSHTPTIFSIAPPTVTIRIPQQYYAVEARARFMPQTDIAVTHPAPGVTHNFGVYLMLRLDDGSESRINVNPVTFVQTPTARITHRDEQEESIVLSAAAPAAPPVPPIGPGVPAPGQERLGFVLLATFAWDGIAVTFSIVQNSLPVINVGSTGLPAHGATHVTTDPIPYPTSTSRGMMPEKSLPYLKNSISRILPAVGSPITATITGTNGPAGDTNYDDPYNPLTARGFSLNIATDASLTVAGSQLKVAYGTPPGGGAGVALSAARSDHQHFVLPISPAYKTHIGSTAYPGNASFTSVPHTVQNVVIDAARPNQLVMLQLDMTLNENFAAQSRAIEITGGASMKRLVLTEVSSDNEYLASSCMVMVRLNGSGAISVQGKYYDGAGVLQNQTGTSTIFQYRFAYLGSFGQG